jgi:Outer membrane lipoprotein-sorting protein
MKTQKYILAAILFSLASVSFFTTVAKTTAQPSQRLTSDEVLSQTAENGRRLLAALREHTHYFELTIQSVSLADTITGEYRRSSIISFDPDGSRREKVLEDSSTLDKEVHIGTSTINNLLRVYQFVISPETLTQYEFSYVGREKVDELSTYVFDVKPKVRMPDPEKSVERYVKGRVWIDDQDLCVVKVSGEALPADRDRRTPRFETYFQNYGRHWFPAFVSADDRIRTGRYSTRVVVKARFTSYKKATARG